MLIFLPCVLGKVLLVALPEILLEFVIPAKEAQWQAQVVFQQPDGVCRPARRAGGVGGQDQGDDKPVEEHPDSGEMEFDRRHRHPALQFFRRRRHVDRLDLAQIGDAVPCVVGVGRQQGREPSLAAPLHRRCGDGTADSRRVRGWISGHSIG